MTKRTYALTEEGHRAAIRAGVREALECGASRQAMRAALRAADTTFKRHARLVDEPLWQLAGGHFERTSAHQLREAIRDMEAELLRRALLAKGTAA